MRDGLEVAAASTASRSMNCRRAIRAGSSRARALRTAGPDVSGAGPVDVDEVSSAGHRSPRDRQVRRR